MRLVVGMIVSSDAMFLRYSLPALRHYVDHIVIVEGCDARWIRMGRARPDGSSLDETASVIQAEAARTDHSLAPISHIAPEAYPHRNAQRQRCLDEMRKVGADVCLIVDADEFYMPEAFAAIREHYSRHDTVCARWPFYNFYTFVRRFHDTAPMERCFRLEAGMHYPDIESGQYVLSSSGEKIWSKTELVEGVACFHYNRVYAADRLLEKMQFYFERDYGLATGLAIPEAIMSEEDKVAILKLAQFGCKVPFGQQPPFARLLAFTQISPLTSIQSLSDLLDIWVPIDLGERNGIYPAHLRIDHQAVRVSSALNLCKPLLPDNADLSVAEIFGMLRQMCEQPGASR